MTRTRSPAAYATIGSVALHGVVAAWLLTRPAPDARRAPVQPIEFAFFEASPAATAAIASEAEHAAPAEPEQGARAKLARKAPGRPMQVAPSAETSASTTPAPPETPETAAPVADTGVTTASPGRAIDISPLAAALTMRATLGAANSCAALSGGDAGCGQGANKQSAPPALASGPRLTARSADELDLERESDGSFSYNDPAFVARIAPDGRVHFEDKIRDLNTFVESTLVGSQINTSAKRRFMHSTAALREQLAARSEARNQLTAAAALRAKLASVLSSGTLTLAQKRSTLFELWDSCASDESGNAAQAAIEGFIRARLPADSPLAYGSAELAQLNKRRVSRRVFDPYGAADAGALPS